MSPGWAIHAGNSRRSVGPWRFHPPQQLPRRVSARRRRRVDCRFPRRGSARDRMPCASATFTQQFPPPCRTAATTSGTTSATTSRSKLPDFRASSRKSPLWMGPKPMPTNVFAKVLPTKATRSRAAKPHPPDRHKHLSPGKIANPASGSSARAAAAAFRRRFRFPTKSGCCWWHRHSERNSAPTDAAERMAASGRLTLQHRHEKAGDRTVPCPGRSDDFDVEARSQQLATLPRHPIELAPRGAAGKLGHSFARPQIETLVAQLDQDDRHTEAQQRVRQLCQDEEHPQRWKRRIRPPA